MVILWDKIPLSNALAMSLQTAQRGGILPPRCAVFLSSTRFQQAGNPRWETETPKEIWTEIWRDPLQSHYKYVIIML